MTTGNPFNFKTSRHAAKSGSFNAQAPDRRESNQTKGPPAFENFAYSGKTNMRAIMDVHFGGATQRKNMQQSQTTRLHRDQVADHDDGQQGTCPDSRDLRRYTAEDASEASLPASKPKYKLSDILPTPSGSCEPHSAFTTRKQSPYFSSSIKSPPSNSIRSSVPHNAKSPTSSASTKPAPQANGRFPHPSRLPDETTNVGSASWTDETSRDGDGAARPGGIHIYRQAFKPPRMASGAVNRANDINRDSSRGGRELEQVRKPSGHEASGDMAVACEEDDEMAAIAGGRHADRGIGRKRRRAVIGDTNDGDSNETEFQPQDSEVRETLSVADGGEGLTAARVWQGQPAPMVAVERQGSWSAPHNRCNLGNRSSRSKQGSICSNGRGGVFTAGGTIRGRVGTPLGSNKGRASARRGSKGRSTQGKGRGEMKDSWTEEEEEEEEEDMDDTGEDVEEISDDESEEDEGKGEKGESIRVEDGVEVGLEADRGPIGGPVKPSGSVRASEGDHEMEGGKDALAPQRNRGRRRRLQQVTDEDEEEEEEEGRGAEGCVGGRGGYRVKVNMDEGDEEETEGGREGDRAEAGNHGWAQRGDGSVKQVKVVAEEADKVERESERGGRCRDGPRHRKAIMGVEGEEEEEEKEKWDEGSSSEEEEGSGEEEEGDPVQVVLQRCEEIAARLRRELLMGREGKRDSDAASGEKEGGRDDSVYSETDERSARLVSQADVTAACGQAVNLKGYQLVGVNFLLLLYRQRVGGAILADEMGLGKTVQAVVFLSLLERFHSPSHLSASPTPCGPHLIVAPASVLDNWQRELARWCPSLKVVFYHGASRASVRQQLQQQATMKQRHGEERGSNASFDVLLTCYTLFERDSASQKDDRKFLRRFSFTCVIMDEAHVLKDRTSQRAMRLRQLAAPARFRLMLTGTPLQNDLQELWSLLEFLLPDVFSDAQEQQQRHRSVSIADYLSAWDRRQRCSSSQGDRSARDKARGVQDGDEGGEGEGDGGARAELIRRMKAILGPFVLRRVKADVMQQLAPKEQKVEVLPMEACQTVAYEEALQQYRRAVMGEGGGEEREKEEEEGEGADEDVQGSSRQLEEGNGGDQKQRDAAMALQRMPKKRLASIFTHLRKLANHPLLTRRLFPDPCLDAISKVAHRNAVFGGDATLARIRQEMDAYSDFDLQQLCESHPCLRDHAVLEDHHYLQSAKCQFLSSVLPRLRAAGHRVLIFSQWTSLLDILQHVMQHHLHLPFLRLDGSTQVSERQSLVDEFNNDPSLFAMLLSTRAGGQGLNLTGADTVIIHDMDFNPQMDRQAEDRAHRIGQQRPVTVYRLVTEGTVDEGILHVAKHKLHLDAAVLSNGGEVGKPSTSTVNDDGLSMASILTSIIGSSM